MTLGFLLEFLKLSVKGLTEMKEIMFVLDSLVQLIKAGPQEDQEDLQRLKSLLLTQGLSHTFDMSSQSLPSSTEMSSGVCDEHGLLLSTFLRKQFKSFYFHFWGRRKAPSIHVKTCLKNVGERLCFPRMAVNELQVAARFKYFSFGIRFHGGSLTRWLSQLWSWRS